MRLLSRPARLIASVLLTLSALLLTSCQYFPFQRTFVHRKGDEIVVAGQLFHTGTRVITWMDPHGYDAYRVDRRFSPLDEAGWEKTQAAVKDLKNPARYGLRRDSLSPDELERVRGGGWDLKTLQGVVDQFVMHYDVCGVSKQCFNVLHDHRGLSIHFMLDIDGTIYQTLDLKERAFHATISNTRSIGIEIANMGAYPPNDMKVLNQWYQPDEKGRPRITIPASIKDPMIYTQNFTGYPARLQPVRGTIQNTELIQYDLTPQQYAALIKLTAALCKVFPKITCDVPREADGSVTPKKLPDPELKAYQGVLGHYHIQTNKTDPGPAFDWEKVINGARAELRLPPLAKPQPVASK